MTQFLDNKYHNILYDDTKKIPINFLLSYLISHEALYAKVYTIFFIKKFQEIYRKSLEKSFEANENIFYFFYFEKLN